MEIEWLILADAAQVTGNKLYVMGGGWTVLTVGSPFPVQQRCAVALAVKVPWKDTNQKHTFAIEVADDDGHQLGNIGGGFEVGRPPGLLPGQDQRVQFAADMSLKLDGPGEYMIVAKIDDQEERRLSFSVRARPGAPPR